MPVTVHYAPESGKHINYENFVYRIWRPALEKSGLPHHTPHDMRHTYATLRLSAGHPIAEVSKEMGHSNPTITYRTYYEFLPKESTSDIDILDAATTDKTAPIRTPTTPSTKKGLAHKS
ncbi:MAG: tyrosine-type recombinase/integrase [Thermodesulfobacteriota bacterium]|nr:tyrosine-type recombinase/integrase [Thermodesulfobacteriota bacterium]